MLTISQYKEIANKLGTPFYLMYPNTFKKNILDFKSAFESKGINIILAYSFKTNYVPRLLEIVLENNCYAEVVSDMEFDLAEKIGFEYHKIIYNGPIKSYNSILKAIDKGCIVNLDSEYEINHVIKIKNQYPDKQINIGLRINMIINTNHNKSAIQDGYEYSHFGLSDVDLDKLIPILKANNINIVSLHGHVSSGNRSVENYKIITLRLISICKKYNLNSIEYLDLGGGFFGAAPEGLDISNKPQYCDYAEGIKDILKSSEWYAQNHPVLIIEPGTSVVANVFDIISMIHQHKNINGKHFVTIDGGMINVKTLLGKANYLYNVISERNDEEEILTDVVGSTCMERDIVLRNVKLRHYSYGDFIHFKGVGAYAISMTPMFINYLFPIIEYNNNYYKIVRKKQNIKNILELYEYNLGRKHKQN